MSDPRDFRPADADAVRAQLRASHRSTGLPILFGGIVQGDDLLLSGFVGTRTTVLRDLKITTRCGLGGRAIAERRPGSVAGYAHSAEITHEYDREVAAEGIQSLAAAPAVVDGRTRAVIYGGLHSPTEIADPVLGRVVIAARRLAREIEVRDEVDRRVRLIENARVDDGTSGTAPLPASVAEGIIESYVALREIAATTTDPALAEQLAIVSERLRGIGRTDTADDARRPALAPRELEVLQLLALGCSNREIATRLGVGAETVKSYLRNLMAKLEVHNRREAVVVARRTGLLP